MLSELTTSADACSVGPLLRRPLSERSVELSVCPDKSLTHRAVIFASMAQGRSVIRNPLDSDDCLGTRKAFMQLGVSFTEELDSKSQLAWRVDSPGIHSWRSPDAEIDLGNSGTSARLLTGLFAGVPGLLVRLTGDHSLCRRPMGRVIEPLKAMGADIEPASGGADGSRLPLTITGKHLIARTHDLLTASAQVKSALLLAGSTCKGQTIVSQPGGSRDHTENILSSLGATVQRFSRAGLSTTQIVGPWMPPAFDCDIPSDPSSVAFFAAMAALHPGLKVQAPRVLTNPSRTGFFKVLARMGVRVSVVHDEGGSNGLGEETGCWSFFRAPGTQLKAVDISPGDIPALIDEVPILSVVAGMAKGVSTFRGLAELRVKESDRLTMTGQLLALAGIESKVEGDVLQVYGGASPRAFSFSSDDHRLVMASMVLASCGDKSSKIDGLRWIRTSFPLFMQIFQNIYSVMSHD